MNDYLVAFQDAIQERHLKYRLVNEQFQYHQFTVQSVDFGITFTEISPATSGYNRLFSLCKAAVTNFHFVSIPKPSSPFGASLPTGEQLSAGVEVVTSKVVPACKYVIGWVPHNPFVLAGLHVGKKLVGSKQLSDGIEEMKVRFLPLCHVIVQYIPYGPLVVTPIQLGKNLWNGKDFYGALQEVTPQLLPMCGSLVLHLTGSQSAVTCLRVCMNLLEGRTLSSTIEEELKMKVFTSYQYIGDHFPYIPLVITGLYFGLSQMDDKKTNDSATDK